LDPRELPAEVRFLVVDDAADLDLKALAAAEPVRVVSQTPEIDGTMMYRELLAQAGGSGAGVAFRQHYVGMLLSSRTGNLAAAATAGLAAVTVAGAEGWSHLAAVAQIGVAGLMAASGKPADALAGYRKAVTFAEAAAKAGDPTGPIMVVQSRMAEGGALFADKKYADAAGVYADTAPKATAANDHLMAMENWRMAAACHELAGDAEKTWECGEKALEAGAKIDAELRPNTTLPFAGQCLLRLTAKRAFADRREKLLKTMNALVGPGWEERKP
jgi:hypothetical protein